MGENTLPQDWQNYEKVPVSALGTPTKTKLSNLLNVPSELCDSRYGTVRGFRGLAECIGYDYSFIRRLEKSRDPTALLLESWKGRDATVRNLCQFLQDIGREDSLNAVHPLICEDVERWNQESSTTQKDTNKSIPMPAPRLMENDQNGSSSGNPTDHDGGRTINSLSRWMEFLSVDDVAEGREVKYDAYINCAYEDLSTAKRIIAALEQPPYNFRLFLCERQLLPGAVQLDAVATIIECRCKGKVVVVLSKNYEKSDACQFATHFAKTLDPASKKKQIVPILMEYDFTVPRILRGMHLIDYQRDDKRGWFWQKLAASIKMR